MVQLATDDCNAFDTSDQSASRIATVLIRPKLLASTTAGAEHDATAPHWRLFLGEVQKSQAAPTRNAPPKADVKIATSIPAMLNSDCPLNCSHNKIRNAGMTKMIPKAPKMTDKINLIV